MTRSSKDPRSGEPVALSANGDSDSPILSGLVSDLRLKERVCALPMIMPATFGVEPSGSYVCGMAGVARTMFAILSTRAAASSGLFLRAAVRARPSSVVIRL
jgi:hypothetical protein